MPHSKFTAQALEIAERMTHGVSPPEDHAAAASVRRVLTTLVVGGIVALLLLGAGIYVARKNSAESVTTRSVERWSEVLAGVIGQGADRDKLDLMTAQRTMGQPVLDRLFQDSLISKYRIATSAGVIVNSSDPGEIGRQLAARTVAMAAHGLFYDDDDDDMTGTKLPTGSLTGYRPVKLSSGQVIGYVGVTADRSGFTNGLFTNIWVGYGCVVVMTLLFGGVGVEFLRRHLIVRHALQARLVTTLVDLQLAEDVARIGYWSVDAKTAAVTWSPQMYKLYGLDPDTFAVKAGFIPNYVGPDEAERVHRETQRIIAEEGAGEIETRIVRPDGVARDVVISIRCQAAPDGTMMRYFGVGTDITERKDALRALELREQELAHAIAATEAVVWSWDATGDIFRSSPQLAQILGFDLQLTGTWAHISSEYCHPDDRDIVPTAFRNHVIEGMPFDVEYRIRHANDGYVWLHSRGRVTEWAGDTPLRMIGTMTDITRRRVAEDALRQSQQTLGLALHAAEAGYITRENESDENYWSPRFLEILGIADSAYRPSTSSFVELIHPDDRSYFQTIFATRNTTKSREYELRVRHASGRYIWLHMRSATEFTPHGESARSIVFVQDVTANHEAVDALAVSEERFRFLAENATDIIALLDETGAASYVSPSVLRLTGYTPEEFIGGANLKLVHPADYDTISEKFAGIRTQPESVEMRRRYRIIRKDGASAWMETRTNIIPGKNGGRQFLTSTRDISDSVAAEEALKESERRFRLLADNSTDVISVSDENGIFKYASPSLERLLGYKPEELIGKNAFADIVLVQKPANESDQTQRPDGKPTIPLSGTFRRRLRAKDGRLIWVESSVQTVRTPEGGLERHSATRDITDRVEYESELRATRDRFQNQATELATLAQNLELERERAEKANNAKSQFLAMMSHELRTPMTGILGMADLILLSDLTAEQNDVMRRLVRSARTLLDLLNDILDFSKIEATQLHIDSVPFRISDVTNEVEALFAPLASEKGVMLSLSFPPLLQDDVIGDAKRLRQILVNLISNAIKFTENGAITVAVSQEPAADGHVILRVDVTDTGIGISEDQLQRLFQPFVQADSSTSRKFGGTGLGLAITRRLVEAMGGTVSVSSEPGKGSTFTFTVYHKPDPNAVARKPARRRRARHVPEVPRSSGQGVRVLVAEDNETTRFLVTTMLGKWGYAVDTVANGQEAVTAVAKAAYDIVLMDIQMPVMDGSEAIAIIRAAEKGTDRRLPIIALTADLLGSHQRSFLDTGADIVIPKPVNWESLMAEMNRLAKPSESKSIASVIPLKADLPIVVLDTATLAELRDVLGTPAFETMIERFLDNSDKYRAEVEAHVKADKLRDAKRAAHALKGLCAQFGAIETAGIAKSIEEYAATVDEIAALLPQLTNSAAETRAALGAYLTKILVAS